MVIHESCDKQTHLFSPDCQIWVASKSFLNIEFTLSMLKKKNTREFTKIIVECIFLQFLFFNSSALFWVFNFHLINTNISSGLDLKIPKLEITLLGPILNSLTLSFIYFIYTCSLCCLCCVKTAQLPSSDAMISRYYNGLHVQLYTKITSSKL